LLNQAPCHEDVWGRRGIAPCILTLELYGDALATLPLGKEPPISIGQEAMGVPKLVWM